MSTEQLAVVRGGNDVVEILIQRTEYLFLGDADPVFRVGRDVLEQIIDSLEGTAIPEKMRTVRCTSVPLAAL
jgi:hypothetical protein